MASLHHIARHITDMIAADPANAERIRALLPEPPATVKPAPRKRAAKNAVTPAGDVDVIDVSTFIEPDATISQPARG